MSKVDKRERQNVPPTEFRSAERSGFANGCYLTKKTVTLHEVVAEIRSGKYSDYPKIAMPGIVLNKFGKRRAYADLKGFTGWWAFDVDKCATKEVANWIKKEIFKVPEIQVSFLSYSGLGVKAIGYWPDTPKFNIDELKNNSPLEKAKVKEFYSSLIESFGAFGGVQPRYDLAQGTTTQPIFFSTDKKILFKQ